MMKKISKLILVLAIAGGAAGVVLYAQRNHAEQEAAEAKTSPVRHEPGVIHFEPGEPQLSALRSEVAKAEAMPAADPVNGRFVYDENMTSRVSSPLTGRIIGLHKGIGDRVSRGEALLDIDSPDLANAEADQAKAGSDELRKRLAFERARQLHDHEVIARKDLEAAEADYHQAQADTRRSAARLRNLQASGHQNGKFVLRAPIGGVVVERHVNPGQEVRPDLEDALFLISDISQLWILVDVPERSLGNIHVGQTVGVETDAYPEQRFTAVVERVGVAVDPVTRRVQIRCAVKNLDSKLKPEMFARVSFLADGERKGIRVPNSALVTEGIYVYVFVETKPGTFEKRKVGLAMRGMEHSFVESGLAEGERVVVEGALLLNSEAAADAQ
jgi:cobalt-zinc-cadmium efflux system membrane fusion protein